MTKSAKEKIPGKRPVRIAPRISRFRTVSVLRVPVRERVKTVIKVTDELKCISSYYVDWSNERTSDEHVHNDLHGQPSNHEGGDTR